MKIYKIALITENAKEFNDYIVILNHISTQINIEVYIVSLSKIYQDLLQEELLKIIQFKYHILTVDNIFNKNFIKYSIIEKIYLVLKYKNKIFDFLKNSDLILSGVQTVFERVLYKQIQKKHLKINTIVYQRHLIFDDIVTTQSSNILHNKFSYNLLSLLGFDGFLINIYSVGFADKYLVLGNINKSYLIDYGIEQDVIYSLGSIEYDDISDLKISDNLNKEILEICYITGAYDWIGDKEGEEFQVEKIFNSIQFIKNNKKYRITFRIHPRENYRKYEILKNKYPFINLEYPSNNKLLSDLKKFDIIMGGFSTVLPEAALINKKIVLYILKKELYRYKNIINDFNVRYITHLNDFADALINNKFTYNDFINYDIKNSALNRISAFILEELDA